MEHEERLADPLLAVEVNAVAVLDVLVVYNKVRSFLDVADERFQRLFAFILHVLEFVQSIDKESMSVAVVLDVYLHMVKQVVAFNGISAALFLGSHGVWALHLLFLYNDIVYNNIII